MKLLGLDITSGLFTTATVKGKATYSKNDVCLILLSYLMIAQFFLLVVCIFSIYIVYMKTLDSRLCEEQRIVEDFLNKQKYHTILFLIVKG